MPCTSMPTSSGAGMRQGDARLFEHFAARGFPDFLVLGLHMAAGQQPTLEPLMFDQEKRVAARMQDQASTSDVPGNELSAGKRRRRMLQKLQDKLLALFRGGIGVAGPSPQPPQVTARPPDPFPPRDTAPPRH